MNTDRTRIENRDWPRRQQRPALLYWTPPLGRRAVRVDDLVRVVDRRRRR